MCLIVFVNGCLAEEMTILAIHRVIVALLPTFYETTYTQIYKE